MIEKENELKQLKEIITVKNILELLSMLILYVFFDAGGIKKYAVAVFFGVLFLFLGRKKKWSVDAVICTALPLMVYVLTGCVTALLGTGVQTMTLKIILYTVMPFILAFSMYTFYGKEMKHIVDVQFLGCLLAYALFDAPTFIKIFRWESVFAFSFGIFALYYLYEKNWKCFVTAILFMLFAEKRIAIVAMAAALLIMGLMWLFRYSKKLAMLLWAMVIVAAYVYIYMIYSGTLEAVCWGANINTNGRVEMYGRMAQEARFSLSYLGKGLGYVENLLSHWNILTYVNLHNDLLKFYVELGFLGFLIYLLSYGVVWHITGKKFTLKKMSFLLVLLVYTMLMFTTDNVSIYMLYLVPFYSIFFAVLEGRNADPKITDSKILNEK